MEFRSYKPDDPKFADYVSNTARRVTERVDNKLPPPFHPSFSDYLEGKTDKPKENVAMAEMAKVDEIVELPDGRQIQIQAKGAPINEKLVERERELANAASERADVNHLEEIQPDGKTKAIGTGVTETKVRSLTGEKSDKK